MRDLVRDTAAGYFIRLLSGRKLLRYPEEIPGFTAPFALTNPSDNSLDRRGDVSNFTSKTPDDDEKTQVDQTPDPAQLERGMSRRSAGAGDEIGQVGLDDALQNVRSQVVHPVTTKDGIILVDWYSLG